MPITTRTVAMRWTRTVLRSNFSRPNLGQINVKTSPKKNMAIGSPVSEMAEAKATVGAVASPMR